MCESIHPTHSGTKWKEPANHPAYWLTEDLVPERHAELLRIPPPISQGTLCPDETGDPECATWVRVNLRPR